MRIAASAIAQSLLLLIIGVSSFLVTTKLPVFPDSFATMFSASKDISLLLCIIVVSLPIVRAHAWKREVFGEQLVVAGYIAIAISFSVLSPLGTRSIQPLATLISAPIIYLLLSQMTLSQKRRLRIIKLLFFLCLIEIAIGLLLHVAFYDWFKQFFMIEKYLSDSGIGVANIIRYTAEGERVNRLLGLAVSPTETASVCLFIIVYANIAVNGMLKLFVYIIAALALLFTGSRSVIFGLVIGYTILHFYEGSAVKKLVIGFLITFAIASVSLLLITKPSLIINRLDGSALIHLYDLFVIGPQLVLKYWYGLGVGMAGLSSARFEMESLGYPNIHLESEYYTQSIQIGVFGVSFLLISMALILSRLVRQRKRSCDIEVKKYLGASFLLSFSYAWGAISFPLFTGSRWTGYMLWIIAGLTVRIGRNMASQTEHVFMRC